MANVGYNGLNTRGANNVVIPFSRLSGSVDSFPIRHQRLYNGLSSGMKALSNKSFERRLMAVLVDNPLYTLGEYDGLGVCALLSNDRINKK